MSCTADGLAVPTEPDMFDSAPRWSPDGSSIAFFRYDGNGASTRHLMVWHVGDPAATALVGPLLGRFGPSWSPQLNQIHWVSVTP